ncbi:high affinity choline transporter 1 [Polynucleobacter sp. HIN5]|uniref:sodium:solute symporter family protein n=1 Tax=Polynucleobacter sp. HIN5 TaxID=3047864 RepID=UPI002573BFDD|nr:sodium:solute symporter family protein [Polynucleobacter sp. HIN5]BEI32811.1 sodium:solute symporter family protein [Polynucleobacter sp. HIN5]
MLLWFVIAYLGISIAIGLYAATKVHNARDYITAGRNLPMAFVLAMVFATWFGAETVLGISATFLEEGFRGLISDPLGASICLVLFGLVFARPLYRMNLITLGDYFRIRYNRQTELLISICIIVSYLGWVSAQISALGLTFNVLSNNLISMSDGMLIGAGVVLVYTLFGGMWSVALTTFVQMIVIVIGLLLVANNAADQAGGVANVIAKANAEGKFNFLPTLDPIDMLGWVAALLTIALGSIPQQDVFQRVNAAKSESIAIWGTALGGIAYFFFASVPLFLAYTAIMIDPQMVNKFLAMDSQMILPTLILDHMPLYIQVIFFGALISVIMSTASGTLLAPSVTFTENILKGFYRHMTDKQFLWATRITVFIFTCIVTYYAVATQTKIHTMVENAYRITLAGAFVPLVAGLFWKKASDLGALLAITFGLTIWLLLEFMGIEEPVEPQLIGLLASAIGMVIGSSIAPRAAGSNSNHSSKAQH